MSSIMVMRLRHLFRDNRVFYIIAFASFGGAFALRIFRDTQLIVSTLSKPLSIGPFAFQNGPDFLPFYFMLNAIVMTWFAGKLGNWLGLFKAENVGKFAFGLTAVSIAVAGGLLPFADNHPLVMLAFYVLSEIPIFMFMNMMWIVATPYFTEEQQKSVFPLITTFAYAGIAFVSGLMLIGVFSPYAMPPSILLGFGALFSLVVVVAMSMLPEPSDELPPDIDEDFEQDDESVGLGLWATAQWAWGIPYLRLFIIATICNFALLGIFDQTMATRATEAQYGSDQIMTWLLVATFIFAMISILIQRFVFERAIRDLGVANINLGAPFFMFGGVLTLFVFDTELLAVDYGPADTAIAAIIAARVFGWFAEFLFNQAMLPYIYGALPKDVEDRGRLFVEGPITAITNGVVGVGLFIYLFVYKTAGPAACDLIIEVGQSCPKDSVIQTAKMDLLIVIALGLAISMLIASFLMKPEYRNAILLRLKAGGNTVWLDDAMKRSSAVLQLANLNSWHPRDRAFVEEFRKVLKKDDHEAVASILTSDDNIPDHQRILAIVKTADEFGKFALVAPHLTEWIKKTDDDEVFVVLAHAIGKLGFDGDLLVKEQVDLRSQAKTSDPFKAHNLIELAMVLRSDTLLSKGCAHAWRDGGELDEIDWSEIQSLPLSEPSVVLDIFLLLLKNMTSRKSKIFFAVEEMLERHRWLRPLVFQLSTLKPNELPEAFKYRRNEVPFLLSEIRFRSYTNSELSILKGSISEWKSRYGKLIEDEPLRSMDQLAMLSEASVNKNVDFSKSLLNHILVHMELANEPGLIASLCKVAYDMSNDEKLALQVNENVPTFLDLWERGLMQSGPKLSGLNHNIRSKWVSARASQWLSIRLWLSFIKSPKALVGIDEEPNILAGYMVAGGAEGDRVLTKLEQHLSRLEFQQFTSDLKKLEGSLRNIEHSIASDPILAELNRSESVKEENGI